MKLLSIRLHPFGGTANRTCTLHDGINVLEGPNEFGKSTLSNALWHALFTSTHLTPAALRNTMGRWYPKPGGDHVRVTLEFEANGQIWTLQKTWCAGAASSLQAEGAASIQAPQRGVRCREGEVAAGEGTGNGPANAANVHGGGSGPWWLRR